MMDYQNEGLEIHSPKARRILVVDSCADTRLFLSYHLQRLGYLVETAIDGAEALRLIGTGLDLHLIILELMLPEMNGFEFAEHVRAFSDVPFIVLSTCEDTGTKVAAIERFAEDYVTKPFDVPVLAARIGRVLNRQPYFQRPKSEIKIDERLSLNLDQRYVVKGDESVSLTPIESRILRVLCDNRGRAVSSSSMISKVWNSDKHCLMQTLRVHIFRVRAKVEADPTTPQHVKTIRGHGYRLI